MSTFYYFSAKPADKLIIDSRTMRYRQQDSYTPGKRKEIENQSAADVRGEYRWQVYQEQQAALEIPV